jgi:hypothetical protein
MFARGPHQFLLFCLVFLFPSAFAQQFTPSALRAPSGTSVPVVFELNEGQAPSTYRFLARNIGGEVRFTDSGPDFLISGKTGRPIIQLRPVGVAAEMHAEGKLPLQAKANYLIGRDASRWISNVSTFAEVAYGGIYPGVDLLFYGGKNHLEHDFVVSSHSDPSRIRFTLTGAEQLELNDSGDLVASAAGEKVILQKPVAYQEIDGKKIKVESAFRLDSSQLPSSSVVSFQLGHYDPARQLIIDPVFTFSTYLTGTGMDQVTAVTTDATGNIYLTGSTSSSDFLTQNAEQPQLGCSTSPSAGCQNAFITKLDPTGHTLLYSTYLGGSAQDFGAAIAVSNSGDIIVAGVSESSNFPHVGAISSLSCQINNNCYFLASLKPDGSALNYSGQIGGSEGFYTNGDNGRLAVDASGNAYLAGVTDSSNFQTTGGTLAPIIAGYPYNSTFVLKVDPTGKLLYSTAIPGSAAPNPLSSFTNFFLPTGIAVDSSGQATISGTGGPGLPTTAGVVAADFPNNVANVEDPTAGYVVQLNATASAVNYGTYVPGTDTLGGMAVDSSGNLYLTGGTSETTLPVSTNAYQKGLIPGPTCTCNAGFIVKLNPQGTSVLAASYLSGTPPLGNEGTSFTSIALDSHSNVFVGGATGSTNFPFQNPFITQWEYTSTAWEMVLAEMSPDLSSVSFGSFLSSTDGTYPGSIFSGLAIDSSDNLVVAGTTYASDFPTTTGSVQPQPPPPASPYTGTIHSFVSKINMATPAPSFCPSAWSVAFGLVPAQTSSNQTFNVTNCGNAPLDFGTITSSVPSITATQSCGSVAPGATCAVTLTFTPTNSSAVSGTISFADNAVISPQVIQVGGQGRAPDLEPASNPLSFGHLLTGTQGPPVWLLLSNRGNAPLTISSISISGNGFSIVQNPCTGTWQAGSFCAISLAFSPLTAGSLNGSLTITSNDPVHGQLTVSLTGTGDDVYAAPVISSIGIAGNTQQTVQINNGPVTLQISGSNFYPASVVQVNGVAQQTTFANNGSLQVTIAASSLTTLGELPLTVVNPGPGGGTRAAATLTPYNVLTLTPSFLVSVPSTGMLYASIPASTIVNPNTVVPINAATGTLGTPIPVGHNPVLLAASSDGKYLYVALAGDQTVQRINLQTQAVERTFPFPANICTTCGTSTPADLQVVPGNSQEVVLSLGNMLVLYNDAGLINYVPGTYSYYYMAPFNSIAFAGNPQSIYSLPFTIVQNSFFGAVTMDATGLHYTPVTGSNYGGNNTTGAQVVADGTLLYTNAGEVWNPATATQTGTFPVTTYNAISYPNERNLTLDTTLGEIFVIGDQDYGGSSANTLTAYGQQSLSITGTLAFPQINSAIVTNLVRWGWNGFAFLGSGNLYIVSSSIASPPTVNPLPTLVSVSPLSANADDPAFTLTLNGTNFLPSSTVAWNNTLLPVTYVNSTQLTVPVPASAVTISGTAELTVSNPGPGGGTSVALPFTITALPAPTLSFSIPGHTFGDAAFPIIANSNSAGAISYSVLSGPATLSGSTLTLTGAGTVSVQASQLAAGSFSALTQTISFTVKAATPSITWTPSSTSITGGSPLGTRILNASTSIPGSFAYTAAATSTIPVSPTTVLAPGTYKLTANFIPTDTTDYTFAGASITMVVNKPTPTVTITSSANPILLLNPVTFTASTVSTATGTVTFMDGTVQVGSADLVNGVAAYTSSSLAVGSHVITASYSGDANFLPATTILTEVVQDFTLVSATSSSPSQTAQRGGTATYNLLLNPSGAPLPSAVTLSVSGLPSGATATFSPSSLAAGAGATPVTLTVQIPADLAEFRRERTFGGVAYVTLALLIVPFIRRRRSSPAQLALILCSGLVVSTLLGCAGSNPSSSNSSQAASKTYTLTVTVTAGADAHTTTLTLIVP